MYEIGESELEAIRQLFQSKKIFRYQGPQVETECSRFEKKFSTYLGTAHSLLVTSGTNAIFLALKAMGIGKGDEVLIPSYTFVATVNAVLMAEATPVIVPITSDLHFSSNELKNCLTSKTKAIIPVHMDGLPCPMDDIVEFARAYGLKVIEDVAQAVGGSFQGRKLGSWGDAGCFSFNSDKIITCGEGGLVTFHDELYFKKALAIHDAPVKLGATHKNYLADVVPELSHSMRVSELSAAILNVQLERLPGILSKLHERKRILLSSLENVALIKSSDPTGDCSTHLHLVMNDPLATSALAPLLTKNGILARPLYSYPAYCFWQWQHLLKIEPESEIAWTKSLGQNRMILSSVIKIAVPFESTPDETATFGRHLNSILAQFFGALKS